ncbi:ATP-grasp fold amidoligase family protein [Butyrivibrio sp. NC3005]|uniref:ATP-grasp fold amidoligase family protein n=1 Tax=Butyrivibrio sp. NC3005 TaxID=1280685 RepID=UPI00040B80CB|nr:ATP-grasp fold amidoligase family protein [Butyrivibrio sp. NC3005]
MDCEKLFQLEESITKEVCLYGAGKYGQGWGMKIVTDLGFQVSCYIDSKISGKCNNIDVFNFDYLLKNKDKYFVFVTVGGNSGKEVCEILENNGINDYYWLFEDGWFSEIPEYLENVKNESIRSRFDYFLNDKKYLEYRFVQERGYEFDIDNPVTLNEKIQWLKVNNRKDIYTLLADKYKVKNYFEENFGKEYVIPTLFVSDCVDDIKIENMPDIPFVLKCNAGSGDVKIIRDKSNVDWNYIKNHFSKCLKYNYYWMDREWCYKNIEPVIMAEKLLLTEDGKLPNDYKIHFLNGIPQFVYCSIDREGLNYRKMYNMEWKKLDFAWCSHTKGREVLNGPEIDCPKTFDKMIDIGKSIAKESPYVRVDFYDLDGKLYCGEVTFYHGGGYNRFDPEEYDRIFGEKLVLEGK